MLVDPHATSRRLPRLFVLDLPLRQGAEARTLWSCYIGTYVVVSNMVAVVLRVRMFVFAFVISYK